MLEDFDHIPLFAGLDREQLSQLEPLFELYSCPQDSLIFEQGAPAAYVYLILQGRVEILYKPYDGPTITITRLKEGDVFGWSAAIGSSTYTSGIRSMKRLVALRIRGEDLRRLCLEHPETGGLILDRLAEIVSSRWKNAHFQVRSILSKGMDVPNTEA